MVYVVCCEWVVSGGVGECGCVGCVFVVCGVGWCVLCGVWLCVVCVGVVLWCGVANVLPTYLINYLSTNFIASFLTSLPN